MFTKSTSTEGILLLNDCHILSPYPVTGVRKNIRCSDVNQISVSFSEGRVLCIEEIEYTSYSVLDIMLETVYRYALLTGATGIICSPSLPISIITYLDQNGILDTDLS